MTSSDTGLSAGALSIDSMNAEQLTEAIISMEFELSALRMRRGDLLGAPDPATWSCKIGEVSRSLLPGGSDAPMREAIEQAYRDLTGEESAFTFSGWGAELTEGERAVVEDRMPRYV